MFRIRLFEHLRDGDGETVFLHACRMGLEGIVAKRRDRPFRSGRCRDWIKSGLHPDEGGEHSAERDLHEIAYRHSAAASRP
jgi:ATP-dependent DNA ligase